LAGGLVSIGLKTGDRIGIWGQNSIEWFITKLASARCGLISVSIVVIISKICSFFTNAQLILNIPGGY
jgi:long-subunit acyl-CoA synthetase (AMP-forming)